MTKHITKQANFSALQRPETKARSLANLAVTGLAKEAALQLLLDLFQSRNFLTFSQIEAVTGLKYSEIIGLKQALIAALGADVTSRTDLGGFFVEH
jgi:hypothetical protein